MEWSNGRTIEFIESYRAHNCLWRSQDANYKNRNSRTDALAELSAKYDMTPKMLLNKIKSLRSYFHKEHSKANKKISGTSNWFAYTALLFILEGDSPRTGEETETQNIDDESENEENNEVEVTEEASNIESYEIEEVTQISSKRAAKKRKLQSTELAEAYNFMRQIKDNLNTRDEFAYFGEVIACKLRKLKDPRLQSTAQFEISKIMFEMETKMNKIQDRNAHVHNDPSFVHGCTTSSSTYSNCTKPQVSSADFESNATESTSLILPESSNEFIHFGS